MMMFNTYDTESTQETEESCQRRSKRNAQDLPAARKLMIAPAHAKHYEGKPKCKWNLTLVLNSRGIRSQPNTWNRELPRNYQGIPLNSQSLWAVFGEYCSPFFVKELYLEEPLKFPGNSP